MTRRRQLIVSWGLLSIIVVAALAFGSLGQPEPTPAERARSLSGQFACPRCDGQSVRDSDVAISRQIRVEIAQWIAEGRSDDEILSSLTQAYGESYLLTPSASGAASLAWAIPVFAVVVAGAGLALAFWRWRPSSASVTDEERELVDKAMRREDRQ